MYVDGAFKAHLAAYCHGIETFGDVGLGPVFGLGNHTVVR